MGGPESWRARLRSVDAQGVRPRDASLPLGRAPRRPPQELRDRRRAGARPPPPGLSGGPPDGLRRLRPAGREQRDQDRAAPARRNLGLDRRLPPRPSPLGSLDRLDPRVRHVRPRLLPVDPVDLPEDVRARARLPCRGAGPMVSRRPDRARKRAGDRRALRALWIPGRAAQPRAVVLPDHGIRGPAPRRLRDARVLARARADDAAQLDRPLRGRRGHLPLRGPGHRLPRLHDSPGHAVRRDLLRARARAPRPRAPGRRDGQRAGRARLHQRSRPRNRGGARGARTGQRPASRSAGR